MVGKRVERREKKTRWLKLVGSALPSLVILLRHMREGSRKCSMVVKNLGSAVGDAWYGTPDKINLFFTIFALSAGPLNLPFVLVL